MLEGYKVSMEARLKQGCAKLHAFNKRISFASSRMELLQGSSQQRSCRHMCDAVRVVNFQDSKFGAWVLSLAHEFEAQDFSSCMKYVLHNTVQQ